MTKRCSSCDRPCGPRAKNCLYCGASLDEAPAAAELPAELGTGPWRFACTGCPRSVALGHPTALRAWLGRPAHSCQFCGSPLELPAVVASLLQQTRAAVPTDTRPFSLPCPACDRPCRMRRGDATTTCPFCALPFLVPAGPEGVPRLGPMRGEPASDAAVEAAVASMTLPALAPVAARILAARHARGEVAAGEPEQLARRFALLANRSPSQIQPLPLSLGDAELLLPRLVFGSTDVGVFRHGELAIELLINLASQEPSSVLVGARSMSVRMAKFAAGAAMGAAGPLALGLLGFEEEDGPEGVTRYQIAVRVLGANGSAEITMAYQKDAELPHPLSERARSEVRRRLRVAQLHYPEVHLIAALFGPACVAGTAFSVQPAAITRRLQWLGLDGLRLPQLPPPTPPTFPYEAA